MRAFSFANGTEFECWQEHNCERCLKTQGVVDWPLESSDCELDEALGLERFGQHLTDEQARRLGWDGQALAWDCPERELPDRPEDQRLRDEGAPMLPGLEAW